MTCNDVPVARECPLGQVARAEMPRCSSGKKVAHVAMGTGRGVLV